MHAWEAKAGGSTSLLKTMSQNLKILKGLGIPGQCKGAEFSD